MIDLQKAFEDLGFTQVRTLIASGNVLFESSEKNEEKLQEIIEKKLEIVFGFTILVILRSKKEIKDLIMHEPFKNSSQEKGTRFQITLFSGDIKSKENIKQEGFEILPIDKRTLASVVYPNGKTTELMTFVDKNFGKNSTTRNWNTLLKLID